MPKGVFYAVLEHFEFFRKYVSSKTLFGASTGVSWPMERNTFVILSSSNESMELNAILSQPLK